MLFKLFDLAQTDFLRIDNHGFFLTFHLIHQYRDSVTFSLYFCSELFFAAVYKKIKDIRLPIFLHAFSNFLTFWKPIWIFIFNYIYWHFLV
ncbi:CPBP family glutamic-type intramembrane protease [Streptococcus sp. DD13]|uniref:CPBP family glutamic-type intramembrane protease n=1 Tax=Streptococcus sp. DD13 TaxID=1777881 RepID=UPI00079207BB|nr:hypothetical protein STRDD13_00643 [Streptococcus sp. DD13]